MKERVGSIRNSNGATHLGLESVMNCPLKRITQPLWVDGSLTVKCETWAR